eukprot:maker-scaffold_84-snap-gene-0.50-mRNA-1 protein AED:0.03 eAED:0.03 QI:63/0.75/0.8/1/1/1/5/432/463
MLQLSNIQMTGATNSFSEDVSLNIGDQEEEDQTKRKVSYFYDAEVGNFHYGETHPMKPHRVRMAHHLIVNYGLYKDLEIFYPALVSQADLTKFHSDDYVNFLKTVTVDNMQESMRQLQRCKFFVNVGEDCPVFDGIYDFCRIYTSGSVGGAKRLNSGVSDVVVNWSGGLHHAKKSEASGFCYINDCVLAILELLKYHERVLYIDIDIHHGDGVEEAFYSTNRVMTLSFHKFGDYFPGTGDYKDSGVGAGKGYAVNFPLHAGINDESFISIFKPVVNKIFEKYKPQAVCLQCGADSLSGDRLGCFNLSLHGHASCVKHVMSFNVPTLVLGGGGYTMRNVARCWTYETATIVNRHKAISNKLPKNAYYQYYGPDFRLHISPSNMENNNSIKSLDAISKKLFEMLDGLEAIPGIFEASVYKEGPPDTKFEEKDEDMEDPDENTEKKAAIAAVEHKAELDPVNVKEL